MDVGVGVENNSVALQDISIPEQREGTAMKIKAALILFIPIILMSIRSNFSYSFTRSGLGIRIILEEF
jgi:hypothetical protein